MRGDETTNKQTKIAGGKHKNNIHTRTRAYTYKGRRAHDDDDDKTRETHRYQESKVVTGVDDANLCVFVVRIR